MFNILKTYIIESTDFYSLLWYKICLIKYPISIKKLQNVRENITCCLHKQAHIPHGAGSPNGAVVATPGMGGKALPSLPPGC